MCPHVQFNYPLIPDIVAAMKSYLHLGKNGVLNAVAGVQSLVVQGWSEEQEEWPVL